MKKISKQKPPSNHIEKLKTEAKEHFGKQIEKIREGVTSIGALPLEDRQEIIGHLISKLS